MFLISNPFVLTSEAPLNRSAGSADGAVAIWIARIRGETSLMFFRTVSREGGLVITVFRIEYVCAARLLLITSIRRFAAHPITPSGISG